jgi:hypothetical protein
VRAVVVITDADAIGGFERAFLETRSHGFTILPTVVGRGRTGLKAGDRIHPGGSGLLFTIVGDDEAEDVLAFVRGVRDAAGVRDATKIYVAVVDEA